MEFVGAWLDLLPARSTRGYRLSFRVGVEDKSEKHSGGSTNLRGIHGREPFASGPCWLQQRREHRLASYACCRLPQTHGPEARAAALAAALMACLQFRRGTECHDPPAQSGQHEN